MSNLKELRAIYQTMTGKPSQANTSSEAIRELVDAHANETDYEITAIDLSSTYLSAMGGNYLLFPKEHLGEAINAGNQELLGLEAKRVIALVEGGHTNFTFKIIGVGEVSGDNSIATRPFTDEERTAGGYADVCDVYGMTYGAYDVSTFGQSIRVKECQATAGSEAARYVLSIMDMGSMGIGAMGLAMGHKDTIEPNVVSIELYSSYMRGGSFAWNDDKTHCTGTLEYTDYASTIKLLRFLRTISTSTHGVLKLYSPNTNKDKPHAPAFINGKSVHYIGTTRVPDPVVLNFDVEYSNHYLFSGVYTLEAGDESDPTTHDISMYTMNVDIYFVDLDDMMAGINMKIDTYRHKLV